MITLLAQNPSFGAAYNIRQAFGLWEETRLITLDIHPLWPGEEDIILTADNADYCRDLIEQSRLTMIVDAAGLIEELTILKEVEANWVTFWGDTTYWQDPEFYNELACRLGVKTAFAMMDVMPVASEGTIPLCNPMLDLGFREKSKLLTIAHSPRTENKRQAKGTDRIERVINRLYLSYPDLRYISIAGQSWRDCLKIKSQAHIFVDQLPYNGLPAGLGKSGEEALVSGAVVLTALKGVEHLGGFFPPPPVSRVYTEDDLYTRLDWLCSLSIADLEGLGYESRAWAVEYLLFPGWLNYVGRYLL